VTEAENRIPPFPHAPVPGFRAGFIAVIGRANVGKSSLVNRLVGRKITITAPIPQTTRGRFSGILTRADAQFVFVDTPALAHPRSRLDERMVDAAVQALTEADVVLLVLDAAAGLTPEDEQAIGRAREGRAPVVVALNKIDRADPATVAALEDRIREAGTYAAVVPVSAVTGANLHILLQALTGLLPEGPPYFPPEMFTDQPEQFLVRELIREQAITLMREEVPYGIAVELEEFAPREGTDLIDIRAILHVERDSHKKMLIGRDGRTLKAIGTRARREIEALLRSRVYLDLWVKTSKGWRDRDDLVRRFYPQ